MKTFLPFLAVLALTATPGAAVEPLWTPAQIIEALKGEDSRSRDLAEGYLYLVPESDFPGLVQVLSARPDQHVDRWAKRITRALLLRGYQPVVQGYLSNRYSQGPSQVAYSLDDAHVLEQTTPEELRGLARAYAVHLSKIPKAMNYSFSGDEFWVRLAGITGEPELMQQVLVLVGSPQGRFERAKMAGRFDPDRCADLLLPAMSRGEVPVRVEVIRLLRSGWQQGPSQAATSVMRDPEPLIRSAFVQTLMRSISVAALEVIIAGLEDNDAAVRQHALAALGSFKGEPQIKLLRKIALEERADASMRQQAWSIISGASGDPLSAEAKALVQNASAERFLRSTAVYYLLRRDGARWLLEVVPRLEPQMKAEVMSALVQFGSEAVLREIPAFVRRADTSLAVQVLSSLGSSKNQQVVLPLLIAQLKDPRPEVRRVAADTLSRVSGLSYRPSVGQDEAQDKDVHQAWSRWYEQFVAEPPAGMVADLATLRAALAAKEWQDGAALPPLSGEVFSPLLRLVGDKNVGTQALMALARLSDVRTAATLIDLVDGPLLSGRRDEVTRALMITRADGTLAPRLFKLLGAANTRGLAMRVLVAWRISSPTLTAAIIDEGMLSPDLLADLMAWKDCPVISAARKLMTDNDADERQRSQAMGLIVQISDERDVKALGREIAEAGTAYRLAIQGLVRMATAGSDSANRELARLISLPTRKTPAKPARPLRDKDKPASEPVAQKPDPAPEIIRALKGRPRGERGVIVSLNDPLPRVIGEWTRNASEEEHQLAGLELLVEARDREGIEVLRNLLQSDQRTLARRAFTLPLGVANLDALPFIELLPEYPALDDDGIAQLLRWHRDVGKLPEAEIAKLRADLRQRQARQAGKPVRGLVLSVEMEGTSAPLGATGLRAKVKIKNVGKTPYSCYVDRLGFTMAIRLQTDERGEFSRPFALDLKPKPKVGGGIEPTIIAPGQTLVAMSTPFEAAPKGYEASSHRIRFSWRVPRSLGATDDDAELIAFVTAWQEFAFLPPLWEAVDRRSSGR